MTRTEQTLLQQVLRGTALNALELCGGDADAYRSLNKTGFADCGKDNIVFVTARGKRELAAAKRDEFDAMSKDMKIGGGTVLD